jgi:hypothetical protein
VERVAGIFYMTGYVGKNIFFERNGLPREGRMSRPADSFDVTPARRTRMEPIQRASVPIWDDSSNARCRGNAHVPRQFKNLQEPRKVM